MLHLEPQTKSTRCSRTGAAIVLELVLWQHGRTTLAPYTVGKHFDRSCKVEAYDRGGEERELTFVTSVALDASAKVVFSVVASCGQHPHRQSTKRDYIRR